jgi:hypothetical protein
METYLIAIIIVVLLLIGYVAMSPTQTAATGFPVGKPVMCSDHDPKGNPNVNVYRYAGDNQMQHYTNPSIANSWDPNWRQFQKIDCVGINLGPDLGMY